MKKRFGITSLFGKESEESIEDVLVEEPMPEIEDLNVAEPEEQEDENLSPLELEYRQKTIEAERISKKISALSDSLNDFAKFSAESTTNIGSISKFIESSRAEIKQRSQVLAENADLKTEILEVSTELGQNKRDLEAAYYEINSLKKTGAELQHALRDARESIHNMRHSNKKVVDSFRSTMAEKTQLNDKFIELSDLHEELQSNLDTAESQRSIYKAELDNTTKELAELEALALQKDDTIASQDQKIKSSSTEVGALNRRIGDLQDEKINLQAKYRGQEDEIMNMKRKVEQEQRKHDNETYTLRSEMENIVSQWRMSKASLKDTSAEVRTLRERGRSAKQRILELEQQLEEIQNERERHRSEVESQSIKIRELNLQYEAAMIDLKQEQIQTAQLNKTVRRMSDEAEKNHGLRIRYDAAMEQIKELKSLIQDYQLIRQQAKADREASGENDDAVKRTNVVSLVADSDK